MKPMRAKIWLVCSTLSTLAALNTRPTLAAETYELVSQPTAGQTVRVEVQLDVGGDLTLAEDAKVRTLKMSVSGKLAYDEKLLLADRSLRRSVRYYDQAAAVIKIDEGGVEPRLAKERRMVVAETAGGRVTLFSPAGPLTRPELDLIDVPANSLILDSLLPSRAVGIGDRWQLADDMVAGLLGLDAVSQSNVECELKEVAGPRAKLELAGRVLGAVGGVGTEIEVKGKYRYDFEMRRVTGLGLLVKERRSIGHVTTGLDVVAKLQLALGPAGDNKHLTDAKLARQDLSPRPDSLLLRCESPTKKFTILHSRDWHLMTDSGELLALRLVDRGELVAQCNVSVLPDVRPGHIPSLAKFQQDLRRSLDKSFDNFVEASESTNSAGYRVMRVVVEGQISDLPLHWHYYLVTDEAGHAAVLAFTVENELVPRLAEADGELVASLRFTSAPDETVPITASRPH
jgi:hypothetical protein